ncbi:MAG: ketosteroid isomerase-like protein [Sphingobacteriales bacterium]|jgi:ketosteroid isomerase-like protein
MSNIPLIQAFYAAFQDRDSAKMKACYSANAQFSDPAFGPLNGGDIGDMWILVCQNISKNGRIKLLEIQEKGGVVSGIWEAHYLFGKKGRKVKNVITFQMTIRDGEIVEHHDHFPMYAWTKQAFGFNGWIMGWTPFFQKKIRERCLQLLHRYHPKKMS